MTRKERKMDKQRLKVTIHSYQSASLGRDRQQTEAYRWRIDVSRHKHGHMEAKLMVPEEHLNRSSDRRAPFPLAGASMLGWLAQLDYDTLERFATTMAEMGGMAELLAEFCMGANTMALGVMERTVQEEQEDVE